MGRKTFQSLPGLLPRRRHLILSESLTNPPDGTELVPSIAHLASLNIEGDVFVIGGAQVYAALFPYCAELYLTYLFESYDGDVSLPPFEDNFVLVSTLAETTDFELRLYRNPSPLPLPETGKYLP